MRKLPVPILVAKSGALVSIKEHVKCVCELVGRDCLGESGGVLRCSAHAKRRAPRRQGDDPRPWSAEVGRI